MRISTFFLFFLLAQQITVSGQDFHWSSVGTGIWKGAVGRPEKYNLLTASGARMNISALAKLGNVTFPLEKSRIKAIIRDHKTYLTFPLDQGEQLFGFGLNFQNVYQRGKILELHVDNFSGKDNGRTHAPTPFYVSSKGYGVFINAARYIKVYAGTAVRKDSKNPPVAQNRNSDKNWSSHPYSDVVEILVPADGVELYIIGGPSTLDAVRRYNLLNGGGCIPPRWGLGFTQRVQRLYTSEMVEKEASEFEEKGFPLDFIGLEPGWQSQSYPCTFEWDKTRFPNPARFVLKMLNKGIRLNLWTNPYVSRQSPIFKTMSPFTASHTVWVGEVPDLSLPEARNIFFGQLQKDQIELGISGYKFDEVDGGDQYLWPDVAIFPSGHSAEQMRQTYGLLLMRYCTQVFHDRNKRTFGLVRANNGGGSSFPFVIYNDYYNHEDFITALINSGFSGVLWTPEVRASKTGEEWLRRFQSNIFSPMAMINAWSSGTKPWSFPEVSDLVKQFAILRMQMMPYWYTEFAKYHFEGTPPFRAMNLEPGFQSELGVKKIEVNKNLEENPYEEALSKEIKDQYMAGEYLLVAPMFTGQTSRKVVLPKGKWFDFYTGEFAGDGQLITVTPGLDKIPVFVKDGGIIPMMPPLMHAPRPGQKVDLEIRHYGEKPGRYLLYDDDGESYNYEKGDYTWREIKTEKMNGQWVGKMADPQVGKPNTVGKVTWRFMTK